MYAAYVFSAILGGGLLLLSILGDLFGGGDAGDLELDSELDVELDLEMDAELDVDTDADGGGASKLLSLRTITYTLFGFGGVGWLLSRMGADPAAASTVVYAAVGGLVSGTLVHRAFGYLRRTESGLLEEETTFVGLAGDVTIPIEESSPGSVAVVRGDRRYTLRALPHPAASDAPPSKGWRTVVVVEMRNGVAYVAPADDDLRALP